MAQLEEAAAGWAVLVPPPVQPEYYATSDFGEQVVESPQRCEFDILILRHWPLTEFIARFLYQKSQRMVELS